MDCLKMKREKKYTYGTEAQNTINPIANLHNAPNT